MTGTGLARSPRRRGLPASYIAARRALATASAAQAKEIHAKAVGRRQTGQGR
jgi:hypothetical protein